MHIQLLNIGFIKRPDGSYINPEFEFSVRILDSEHVEVQTATGKMKSTIEELEEAILGGGFGEVTS
jgi:hypothetical protein